MLVYVSVTDLGKDDPMIFSAENQEWDDATLKQLKDEYNIIFQTNGDGVIPVMLVDKNSENPLIAIGYEDDGTIFFERKQGLFKECFSAFWVKFLIADLEEALKMLNAN